MAHKMLTRRNFLRGLTAGAVGAVGLRFANHGRASGPHGESEYKWAMVIDQEKCIGCGYCTLACRAHNDINPDISWNQVIEVDEMGGRKVYLPLPCMHCEDATCVQVCPVKASYHRPDGIVMMDYDLCIGCRYCEVACPYGARSFNWKEFTGENPAVPEWGYPEVERRPRGVVEKCSFCYQRIDRGLANG
jgi:Fe-S-cluster-containing dehydrogenase component